MVKDKHGKEIEVGDVVKFEIEGEVHFGEVEHVHEDGDIDVNHVVHRPKAVEHHIKGSETTVVHADED